jgi:hypothetical protein
MFELLSELSVLLSKKNIYILAVEITGFFNFVHRPVFYTTQNFGNLICFGTQVRGETPTLFGPIEKADFSYCSSFRNALFFLENWMKAKAQEPSTPQPYKRSSEIIRIEKLSSFKPRSF